MNYTEFYEFVDKNPALKSSQTIEKAFYYAIRKNRYDLTNEMIDRWSNIVRSIDYENCFRNAFYHGDYEKLKYLLSIWPDVNIVRDFHERAKLYHEYYLKNSDLTFAKYIYNLIPSIFTWKSVYTVCRHGNLQLCKWLCSCIVCNEVEIRECFNTACLNGHIEIAKWLVDYKPDVKYTHEAFYDACKVSNIRSLQYMCNSFPYIFSDIDPEHAFKSALGSCNLETVKWISTKYNIDVKYQSNNFLNNSTIMSASPIVIKWLIEFFQVHELVGLINYLYARRTINHELIAYIIRYFDVRELKINVKSQKMFNDAIQKIQESTIATKSASNY